MIGVASLLILMIVVFFIAKSIADPISRISADLKESADQVVGASGQVSSSSQQLSEGASEQAASIEETSSSLEEMSSMTKQNADNANQANSLSSETKATTESCSGIMQEMAAAIGQVDESSKETQKIVRTIDEIAFQTNLLALNAAVEAARAGEAGAGFAVVADEVRNLAIRAAEAAKNTTEQIEDIGRKINDAMEMVFKTIDEFTKVDQNTGKVSGLVEEIAAASSEQARGIEQVNIAVTEMDRVVQQNAANAEESASASEEMNAQAEHMKVSVNDLTALVWGGRRSAVGVKKNRHAKSGNDQRTAGKGLILTAREVSPNQLIQPDNDEFKDF
jgi:methyl-accepting chemotaxis protein